MLGTRLIFVATSLYSTTNYIMQLGYKTVLLICIVVSIATSEAISFLPAFTEHKPQVKKDLLI